MIEQALTRYWSRRGEGITFPGAEGITEAPAAYRAAGARFPRMESAISIPVIATSDALYSIARAIDPAPRGEGGSWATSGARWRLASALYRASRSGEQMRILPRYRFPR